MRFEHLVINMFKVYVYKHIYSIQSLTLFKYVVILFFDSEFVLLFYLSIYNCIIWSILVMLTQMLLCYQFALICSVFLLLKRQVMLFF